MTSLRVSHIGICVSDWERSLRFYHDQLGFRFVDEQNLAGAFPETLHRLKGVGIHTASLEREGVRIELRQFTSPSSISSHRDVEPGRDPLFDRPGSTHLAMRVDDLDAALAKLAAAGVEVMRDTRAEAAAGELGPGLPARRAIFICDPDGMPIELQETSGD